VVHLLQILDEEGGEECADHLVCLVGSSVNQDGRSSSLTAPNGPAQQAVLRESLHVAGLAAGEVGALEMHGTGTALGDPIEIGAALAVLPSRGSETGASFILTAAKSRLGHAETGAGALGMLHAARHLEECMPRPITHLREINPYVSSILQRHSGPVVAHRQAGPAMCDAGALPVGASSFAFQVRAFI